MQHNFIVDVLKTRLDKFLVSKLPDRSRSLIQRDIEAGLVTVDGSMVAEPKHVVRQGTALVYQPSAAAEGLSAKPLPITTLYNNHGLLVIDKPAGLSVHPGAGVKGDSLAAGLLYQFADIAGVGEAHRPGIVHRLDKDTSGVMLIARTPAMYEYLKDAFAERKVKKEYLALVWGRLEPRHGVIDAPIGKSKRDFRRQTTINPLQAKSAVTEYMVSEYLQFPGSPVDEMSLLRVQLHTGRTHQIRVHLASLGHPLIGDSLYGKKAAVPGLDRQFLHAYKIEVQLPDKTWIEAESELPEDLRDVLKSLGSKVVSSI
jgi:23S rRNA pseudouridine1911/1915/1917 synthase